MKRSLEELKELVGTSLTTVEGLCVEAGKVEEFARAIGFRDSSFCTKRSTQQDSNSIPAPPTFTRTAVFPRYRPSNLEHIQDATLGFDLGFEKESRIHGEHEFRFERPVFVGDTLTGKSKLTDVYQRTGTGGNVLTFAVIVTEYRDDLGDPVLTEHATLIENPAGFSGNEPDNGEEYEVGENSTCKRVHSPHEISIGDQGPRIVETLDRKDFVRYAGASGGLDRYHYDEPYARSNGYQSVFGQGMLAAGYASQVITRWFGIEAINRFKTRFHAPIWPNDRIAFWGVISDCDEQSATIKLLSKNNRGEDVLSGSAIVSFPSQS